MMKETPVRGALESYQLAIDRVGTYLANARKYGQQGQTLAAREQVDYARSALASAREFMHDYWKGAPPPTRDAQRIRDLATEVEETARSISESRSLRVPLSKGLGQAIRRYSGTAVFGALKNTSRGYMFESSDPGVVRAFWHATNDVLHRPPTNAIGDAVVKLRTGLRPVIEDTWPEVLAR